MPKPQEDQEKNNLYNYVKQRPNIIKELKLTTIEHIAIMRDRTGQRFCLMHLNTAAKKALDECVGHTKLSFMRQTSHVSVYEKPQAAWNRPTIIASFHIAFKFTNANKSQQIIIFYFSEHGDLIKRGTTHGLAENDELINNISSSGVYMSILMDIYNALSSAQAKFGPQILDQYPKITFLYSNIQLFGNMYDYFKLLDAEHDKDCVELFKRAFPDVILASEAYLYTALTPNLPTAIYKEYFSALFEKNIYVQTLVAICLLEIFRQIHAADPNLEDMLKYVVADLKTALEEKIKTAYSGSVNLDTLVDVLSFAALPYDERKHPALALKARS